MIKMLIYLQGLKLFTQTPKDLQMNYRKKKKKNRFEDFVDLNDLNFQAIIGFYYLYEKYGLKM